MLMLAVGLHAQPIGQQHGAFRCQRATGVQTGDFATAYRRLLCSHLLHVCQHRCQACSLIQCSGEGDVIFLLQCVPGAKEQRDNRFAKGLHLIDNPLTYRFGRRLGDKRQHLALRIGRQHTQCGDSADTTDFGG
ncbi:hypothetical protein D3C75_884680 [compost metagenome]